LYPFQKTIRHKYLSQLTIRPRFVGLAARPRAATLPHTAIVRLCVRQSWRLLRCSAGGCFAPATDLLGARSALPDPGGRGARLAARGRPAKPADAHPKKVWGSLGGIVEHVTIVLAGAPGYRTRPIPAFGARLRQSGGGKHRMPTEAPKTSNKTKNDPGREATPGQVNNNRLLPDELLGGAGGASGVPCSIQIVRVRTGTRPAFSQIASECLQVPNPEPKTPECRAPDITRPSRQHRKAGRPSGRP